MEGELLLVGGRPTSGNGRISSSCSSGMWSREADATGDTLLLEHANNNNKQQLMSAMMRTELKTELTVRPRPHLSWWQLLVATLC